MQSRLKYIAVATVAVLSIAVTMTALAQKKAPPAPPKAPPAKKAVAVQKPAAKPAVAKKPAPKAKAPAKHKHHRRHRRHRRVRHHAVASHGTSMSILSGAESGLVGVHLFDSGMKLLAMFGNPDEIDNISGAAGGGGGGGFNGGGGGGGGGGAPAVGARGNAGGPPGTNFGGPPTGRGAGGGGGRGRAGTADIHTWDFLDNTLLRVQGGQRLGGGTSGGDQGGSADQGSGVDNVNAGIPPYFVRWIYKKAPSQFSFIMDKNDRVVQIEAVGMGDSRVRTNKGIGFGSTFQDILRRYSTPEAYEINGDSLVLRYLTRSRIAFRLNRLVTDKPHVVTAIVVAGGKV